MVERNGERSAKGRDWKKDMRKEKQSSDKSDEGKKEGGRRAGKGSYSDERFGDEAARRRVSKRHWHNVTRTQKGSMKTNAKRRRRRVAKGGGRRCRGREEAGDRAALSEGNEETGHKNLSTFS